LLTYIHLPQRSRLQALGIPLKINDGNVIYRFSS
jgi:hypothetical protein